MANFTKKNILVYLPVTLCLVVIIFQVSMQKNYNLTKWKGGGFGMYTEMHHTYYTVDVRTTGVSNRVLYRDKQIAYQIDLCKILPTDTQLKKLATLIRTKNNNQSVHIVVLKPKLSAVDMSVSMEKINQLTIK